MASIIRIKRSSTSGNPSTLGAGELAYSAYSGSGGNRLYIGMGSETAGNAVNHYVIGGTYYTGLIDASTAGTLTTNASSIPVLSATGTIDKWLVGNLQLTANTISSTNTNGNISLTPNGTGLVQISGAWTLPSSAGTNNYILTSNGAGGSSWVAPASQSITLAGGSGSGTVSTGGTLTFTGGNGITTSISGSTVTISSIGAGGYVSTATGGGTTTLTASSSANQYFTGTTTQTVKLPDTSTLTIGQEYIITNNSTGNLTVQTSAAGALNTQLAGTQVTYIVASTVAQTWVQEITGYNSQTGTGANVLATGATLTNPVISTIINTGTLTLPTSTDTLVGRATTDTFTNKTFDTAGTGNVLKLNGNTVSSYTGSGAVVMLSATPTITGGINYSGSSTGQTTLQASASASGTLTLPAATDTLVGKATTDTFTNKTFDTAGTGNSFKINGTAITAVTGSGSVVLATSPTLVTPTLGVATATSINGLTISSTTGALTIANAKTATVNNTLTFTGNDGSSVAFGAGGTVAYTGTSLAQFASTTSAQLAGVISDETGSGSLVFATSPTLVTPILGAATATSITGSSGNLTITAAAGNNNVNLVPTGTGTVDAAGARITSVGTPTQTTDAATKGYVDSVKQALDIKDSCRVATTANLTVTASGTGAGKTLTNAGTQAAITIDSIVLNVGERVLVKDQTTQSNNGIYTVTNVGSISTNWVLTRATDADNSPSGEVTPGMFTFVEEGTVNADSGWVLTTDGAVTIDTTALTFVQFSGAGQVIAGGGLTKTGNQIDVVGTANRIIAYADNIDIAPTYVGQTSITTLGTITTGTWNGTLIGATYGGTGVNNGSNTITLGGSVVTAGAFTTAGAYALTLTTTGATNVTLPTTGTLATLAGAETLSNKTITSSSFSGSTLSLTGNASVGGTLSVTSTSSFTGNVSMSANLTGAGASTSTIDGFQIDGGTY